MNGRRACGGFDPALFATPLELGLSERAQNAFRMLGAECIGDLAQRTEAELLRLPNTGRKTVHEIREALAKVGLRLGMDLPEWNQVSSVEVRTSATNDIRRAVRQLELGVDEARPSTLQDEIRLALSKVAADRNLALILSLWGLDGTERKTLEQVGRAYGMTRERVRQIEAANIKKLRVRWHELPLLDASVQILSASGPVPADDVSRVLRDRGVPTEQISAAALLRTCEAFERKTELAISSAMSRPVVGKIDQLQLLTKAKRHLRRATESFGCTSLSRIQFQLSGTVEASDRLRDVLDLLDEVSWLDANRTWLFSRRPARNRLQNLVEKIFTVTQRVHVTELRQAVSRPHRMKYVPPAAVLAAFCGHLGYVRTAENEVVAGARRTAELGDLDGAFVRGFQRLGSPLTREELEDYCVEEEGMKVSSFFQRLSYCPLFLRLAPGVYGLVGTRTPAGSVEAAKKRIKQERTAPQYGWTAEGRMWVVFRLSRASIQSGAFFVPTFVNEHAEGSWNLALPDGTLLLGNAEIKQGLASGVRDAFDLLAADPGDFCLMIFDFTNNIASVQVGGSDLEDQATEQAAHEDEDPEEFEAFDDDVED